MSVQLFGQALHYSAYSKAIIAYLHFFARLAGRTEKHQTLFIRRYLIIAFGIISAFCRAVHHFKIAAVCIDKFGLNGHLSHAAEIQPSRLFYSKSAVCLASVKVSGLFCAACYAVMPVTV